MSIVYSIEEDLETDAAAQEDIPLYFKDLFGDYYRFIFRIKEPEENVRQWENKPVDEGISYVKSRIKLINEMFPMFSGNCEVAYSISKFESLYYSNCILKKDNKFYATWPKIYGLFDYDMFRVRLKICHPLNKVMAVYSLHNFSHTMPTFDLTLFTSDSNGEIYLIDFEKYKIKNMEFLETIQQLFSSIKRNRI